MTSLVRVRAFLRRSPWLPVGLAVLTSGALAACELIVGDVTIPVCTPTGNECEVLNVRDGLSASSCPHWACNAQQHCVKSSDADGDGHASSACGGDDCDDSSPTAFPGGMEVCNGVDDDCNGLIDDNHYVDQAGTVVSVTATAMPSTARYSAGVPGKSAVIYRDGRTLEGTPLAGTARPSSGSAVTVHLTTNSRGTSTSTDGLFSLGVTTASMPDTCTTLNTAGSPTCSDDTVCLRDHGACVVQDGGCTMGAPFGPRCYDVVRVDAGPGADGGSINVANDNNCRRQDRCVHGACVAEIRDDLTTMMNACTIGTAALDHVADTRLVLAGIDVNGCAAGALRLYTAGADLAEAAAFGPEARSNVYLGVDVAPGMDFDAGGVPDGGATTTGARCTGLSRTDFRFGAASPSVATLRSTSTPPQALVTYLARGTDTLPACADTVHAPVGVMAAFVEDTGLELPTLMGSNGGVPQDIGHTSGIAPAAVASLDATHYVVAFPDADAASGGIGIWVVPAAMPPPTYQRFVPSDGGLFPDGGVPPDGTIPMVEVAAWRTRPSPALAVPAMAAVHLPAAMTADHVAVSVGPSLMDGGVRLGVTWQEGCDTMNGGTIKFAIVDWHPTAAITMTTPVEISTGTMSAANPSLVYVPDGFVTAGWRRTPTGPAADASSDGGWLVGFVAKLSAAGRRATVVRVSELDGQPLPEAPQDTNPMAAMPRATSAALYSEGPMDSARAAFASVDADGLLVTGGTLMCVRGASSPDGGM